MILVHRAVGQTSNSEQSLETALGQSWVLMFAKLLEMGSEQSLEAVLGDSCGSCCGDGVMTVVGRDVGDVVG